MIHDRVVVDWLPFLSPVRRGVIRYDLLDDMAAKLILRHPFPLVIPPDQAASIMTFRACVLAAREKVS